MNLLKRGIDAQVSTVSGIQKLRENKESSKDNMKLSPLHYAALYNKPETVAKLLDQGADIDACDVQGETPLHYAARYKQRFFQTASGEMLHSPSSLEVVKCLISNGADVNKRDIYGDTALFYAILRGNTYVVVELLAVDGVDIESSDHRGYSSLHIAARFNRMQIGETLIEAGVDLRGRSDTHLTPFMIACAEGNQIFCQLLLSYMKGKEKTLIEDITLENESGLDFAIENRHPDIVKLCIEKGATVLKTCREVRSSPLHIASTAGDKDICEILLQKDEHLVNMRNAKGETPLHRAAQFDRDDVIHVLLDWKADIEAQDTENYTALLTSVTHGSEKATRALLRRGAHLSALDKEDRSVLHLAAKNNAKKCLEILLEFAREQQSLLERIVSADDREGNSPLHVAADQGNKEITALLLENGADVENKNEDEEIALHVAASRGQTLVIKELLNTVDQSLMIVNDTDEEENTPLHLAARRGHLKAVQALIEADADVTNTNRFGWTPMLSAVDGGYDAVVRELIEHGSEIDCKDRNQNSALHIASQKGHAKVVQLLLQKGAVLSEHDQDGHNPLDVAIKYGKKDVAKTIVHSEQWRDALRNKTPGNSDHFDYFHTPLRKLVVKMPDVCELVFDRCISYPKGMDVKHPDLEILCDFQFLDDTYTATKWGDAETVPIGASTEKELPKYQALKIYKDDGEVVENAVPYTDNSVIRESNHPLQYLVDYKRGELLYHPLVLALVRQKWKVAQVSYFSFLLFFVVFVTMFTIVMVSSKPPFMYNGTEYEASDDRYCENLWNSSLSGRTAEAPRGFYVFASFFLWIMAGIGITIEIGQIYSTPLRYLRSATNLLDWFGYLTIILVLIPIHPCALPLHWQWQLGAAGMFISWINLILFCRRLPGVGIYIVMVGEVFITFIKFFIFCFSLFIFAFGFTFYVVLRNQVPFQTPFYAFVKTGVMMIGEMEYEAMFHGEDDDLATTLFYEPATFLLFIIFLCMVTIVIMNLLTGLAVGDVQEIQEQAKLKKLAMQVELCLDVETTLPEKWRKKLQMVIGYLCLHPNKVHRSFISKIGSSLSGPLSSSEIAAAIYRDVEDILEDVDYSHVEDDDLGPGSAGGGDGNVSQESLVEPTPTELELKQELKETQDRLEYVMDGMDRMERMFKLLLEQSNISTDG